MPRRNRCAKGPTPHQRPEPESELTYDQVARRLVMQGLASPLILDHRDPRDAPLNAAINGTATGRRDP